MYNDMHSFFIEKSQKTSFNFNFVRKESLLIKKHSVFRDKYRKEMVFNKKIPFNILKKSYNCTIIYLLLRGCAYCKQKKYLEAFILL